MFAISAISAICSKTANISLRKYLFVGETTMNIVKFDCTQNKMQNLIPVKCFESKICKKNVPANNCNIKV